MWAALLRKELRQLAPWATLIFGALLVFALWLAFDPPQSASWASETPFVDSLGARMWNGFLMFWAVVFAYAGFPREHDDQTLRFLFTLPVSRARLFAGKFLTAGALLSALVLGVELLRWVAQIPNPESFGGHSFRIGWALTSVSLGLTAAWINLAYASFLAVFRRFGLLLGGVVWTLLALLAEKHPAWSQLSPLELMHVEFFYANPILPWKALFGHAVVSGALGLCAAFVWVGPSDRFADALSRLIGKNWVRWSFIVALIGVVVFVSFAVAKDSVDEKPTFGTLEELSGPQAELRTARFHFRFPERLRPRVQHLSETADSLHDTLVQRLMGTQTQPTDGAVIEVNLLKHSHTHAGSATWNAIRMDLDSTYDDQTLTRTLVHETTHVIELRASDRRMDTHASTLRFLDEGLAEYMSLELAPDAPRTRAHWLAAVLLRQREHVEPSVLLDFATLMSRLGEPAVYPLGFTWVDALVRTCAADAPRRILGALARPELRESSGEPLLRSALQLANCDATRVSTAWQSRLDALALERKADIEKIPKLVGALQRAPQQQQREPAGEDEDEDDDEDESDLVVRAELEGKPLEGASYRLFVRGRGDVALENQIALRAELDPDNHLQFRIPSSYISDGSVDFQLAMAWEDDGAFVESVQEWRHARVAP